MHSKFNVEAKLKTFKLFLNSAVGVEGDTHEKQAHLLILQYYQWYK